MGHHPKFLSSFFPHVTQGKTKWDVISSTYPCLSEPELAAPTPRAWEADGESKNLGTKAYLALRSSSILMVKLEQITTVQQEKPFSGKERRLYGSHCLPSVSFPDLSRCCAI